MSVLDRLSARLVQSGDCWLWQGTTTSDGYGQIKVSGKTRSVHRVAYELLIGPIPDGLDLDHLCRVRSCCNPYHLDPVPSHVNQIRGDGFPGTNSRKHECPQGHVYDQRNTLLRVRRDGRTYRRCRVCCNANQRAMYANRRRALVGAS